MVKFHMFPITLLSQAFETIVSSDRMENNLLMSLNIKTSKEDIEMFVAAFNEFIKDNGRYLDGETCHKRKFI